MGYRIDFALGGGVLRAVVSGRSALVLVAARRLGCELRRFDDEAAALSWLQNPRR